MVMAAHSVIEGFYCLLIDGCLCRVATLIQRKFADGSITVKVTNKTFLPLASQTNYQTSSLNA